MLLIRAGPAWELWPNLSHTERKPVFSSGIYISWDDDNDDFGDVKYYSCKYNVLWVNKQ